MQEVFKDLKVIELASVLAGPSVGYFFAELGARVVKIENPITGGDVTRTWKLPNEDKKEKTSAYFWSVNALKEINFINISETKGLQQLYSLVKEADIVLVNYKKGDAKKLKVDYPSLKKINPKLIYAALHGFDEKSERTAYDLILQAESGFMFMNGEKGSLPTKMPVAIIDLIAAHQMKEAILIALLKRNKTNKGYKINVSLFQSALASLANQATNWLIAGHLPKASGSLHPNIAPYGEIFFTKDKHSVTFAIGSNKQFTQLCEVINNNSLAKDVKYSTNQNRVKNRQELYAILNNHVCKFNYKDLFRLCVAKKIPIAKIRNMKEVFELEDAKVMLREIQNGTKKTNVVSSIAFTISEL